MAGESVGIKRVREEETINLQKTDLDLTLCGGGDREVVLVAFKKKEYVCLTITY
jgi:hypothetical protein